MLNAVSQWDEKLKVFANRVARVCFEILAQTLAKFPMLEIVVDPQEAPMLLAKRLALFLKENGVEQRCPRNDHQRDLAAGFEFDRGLVVNLNGQQRRISSFFERCFDFSGRSSHWLRLSVLRSRWY